MGDRQQEGEPRKRNPIIGRAIAHFGRSELREVIALEEWGDEEGVPLRIFCLPMNVLEKQELMDDQARNGVTVGAVNLIIRKACDDDGKRLFSVYDKRELREAVSPVIVEKVAAAILATEFARAEEIEKK